MEITFKSLAKKFWLNYALGLNNVTCAECFGWEICPRIFSANTGLIPEDNAVVCGKYVVVLDKRDPDEDDEVSFSYNDIITKHDGRVCVFKRAKILPLLLNIKPNEVQFDKEKRIFYLD